MAYGTMLATGIPTSPLDRLVRRLAAAEPTQREERWASTDQMTATTRAMVRTLTSGLEARDSELHVVEHCARVAELCGTLGALAGVSRADAYLLDTAAKLHEIGMFTVPQELLTRVAPLSADELGRVRSQARISAEIAATMHHPRVVTLIENQYADHAELVDRLDEGDLFLAGILRVADVMTAVTRPRPYQAPLSRERRARLLQAGSGTRFHPAAVRIALRLHGG